MSGGVWALGVGEGDGSNHDGFWWPGEQSRLLSCPRSPRWWSEGSGKGVGRFGKGHNEVRKASFEESC